MVLVQRDSLVLLRASSSRSSSSSGGGGVGDRSWSAAKGVGIAVSLGRWMGLPSGRVEADTTALGHGGEWDQLAASTWCGSEGARVGARAERGGRQAAAVVMVVVVVVVVEVVVVAVIVVSMEVGRGGEDGEGQVKNHDGLSQLAQSPGGLGRMRTGLNRGDPLCGKPDGNNTRASRASLAEQVDGAACGGRPGMMREMLVMPTVGPPGWFGCGHGPRQWLMLWDRESAAGCASASASASAFSAIDQDASGRVRERVGRKADGEEGRRVSKEVSRMATQRRRGKTRPGGHDNSPLCLSVSVSISPLPLSLPLFSLLSSLPSTDACEDNQHYGRVLQGVWEKARARRSDQAEGKGQKAEASIGSMYRSTRVCVCVCMCVYVRVHVCACACAVADSLW